MLIRHYQPGDEEAQARIFNTAAGSLPRFKPATAEEIARRYQATDPNPATKFYATVNGEVVGYAVINPNGRISYPWCLPEARIMREPLLRAVLAAVNQRGDTEAWAAYRADWTPVLDFFRRHGFTQTREMINYIAELRRLPHAPLPAGQVVTPVERSELPQVIALGAGVLPDDPEALERFYWDNPHFGAESVFALKQADDGQFLGTALAIGNAGFADPTKLDAAMPCFRLGALGTERERHKRVNGMFSSVFKTEEAAEALLTEAVRRFEQAGLTHIAAQAPSDAKKLCAFHDRFFERQGSFPILSRRLHASES